jgi:hypothetical protein
MVGPTFWFRTCVKTTPLLNVSPASRSFYVGAKLKLEDFPDPSDLLISMKRLRGTPKIKAPSSFEFILDELAGLDLQVRRMFGCTALYVGPKIMLVLCDREQLKQDRGIWVCIPDEHALDMKRRYPELRGVSFFENENSAWQCLALDRPDFEELALEFCALIRKGDPRIGRTPKAKARRKKP